LTWAGARQNIGLPATPVDASPCRVRGLPCDPLHARGKPDKKKDAEKSLLLHFPQDRTPRNKAARVQRMVAALAAAKDISRDRRALTTDRRRNPLDAT